MDFPIILSYHMDSEGQCHVFAGCASAFCSAESSMWFACDAIPAFVANDNGCFLH